MTNDVIVRLAWPAPTDQRRHALLLLAVQRLLGSAPMMLNDYGFPVSFDDAFMVDTSSPEFDQRLLMNAPAVQELKRFERAKSIAAEARARNFPPLCDCKECTAARNLPAVLRILAKWTPMDRVA